MRVCTLPCEQSGGLSLGQKMRENRHALVDACTKILAQTPCGLSCTNEHRVEIITPAIGQTHSTVRRQPFLVPLAFYSMVGSGLLRGCRWWDAADRCLLGCPTRLRPPFVADAPAASLFTRLPPRPWPNPPRVLLLLMLLVLAAAACRTLCSPWILALPAPE